MSEPREVPPPDTPVDAVIFDYGMTLVTYHRPVGALEAAYGEIAAFLRRATRAPVPDAGVLLVAVHDAVEAAVARHEQTGELREIDLRAVYRLAYRDLGLHLRRPAIDTVQRIEQRAWFEGIRVPPVTLATLGALRWRGVRLGICSNAPYHHDTMVEQLTHLGLRSMVDGAVFSSGVGWRKPSPRIFRRALGEVGVPAARALMVGDRMVEDVDGAHAAGMRAVRLRAHLDDRAPEERAEHVIDSLDEVVAIVDRCGRRP